MQPPLILAVQLVIVTECNSNCISELSEFIDKHPPYEPSANYKLL